VPLAVYRQDIGSVPCRTVGVGFPCASLLPRGLLLSPPLPTMRPTHGPSRCTVCGVTKANTAAMRKHTLAAHPLLGRNANRRVPRQLGRHSALGGGIAAVAASPGGTTPAPPGPPPTLLPGPPPPAGSSPRAPPVLGGVLHSGPAGSATPVAPAAAADAPLTDNGTIDGPDDCDADDALLLLQLSRAAAEKACQEDGGSGKPPLSGQPTAGDGVHAHNFSSVATEAQAEYERIGDDKRAEPAVHARPNCNPGQFKTPALQMLQMFVHECNGSGLSTAFQTRLYDLLAAWDGSDERRKPVASGGKAGATGANRIKDVFPSATAFRNAVRDDLDDAILSAGWKKCTLVQGGVSYVTYFRSALRTALDALRNAKEVQLRRDDGEVGDRRQAPMDGEAFRAHQDAVDATSIEKAFVLGLYVYSDASLLSWSGGTCRLVFFACMLFACYSTVSLLPPVCPCSHAALMPCALVSF